MSDPSHRPLIRHVAAGTMDYRRCWELQQTLHARVVKDPTEAYVVTVEHPPVLTFGRHADKKFLLFGEKQLRAEGVDLVDTDRGGEVTAHVPGQLVVYPILGIEAFRLTPRRYVQILEQTAILVLADYGVTAARDPEHPGVWVGSDKICAIGVRIQQRVSLHGMALNVSNAFELFRRIVPCGIAGRGVTSLSKVIEKSVAVPDVLPKVLAALAQELPGEDPRLILLETDPLRFAEIP